MEWVSWYLSLETVQVIGRWKYRRRERVPEFTRERDERLRILVNSCIRRVDRIGVGGRSKSCAARPREQGRDTVSKIRRTVSMQIAVKDASEATLRRWERSWRQSVRGGELIRRKAFDPILFNRAVWVEPPQTCEAYSIHGRIRPRYSVSSCGGEKNWRDSSEHLTS